MLGRNVNVKDGTPSRSSLGLREGTTVGLELGDIVGGRDGEKLGRLVGLPLGLLEGFELGDVVGSSDGGSLGLSVGPTEGPFEGKGLGINEGEKDGLLLGVDVGAVVGTPLGSELGRDDGLMLGNSECSTLGPGEGSKVEGETVGPPVILEVGDDVRSNASKVGSGEGLSVAEDEGLVLGDPDCSILGLEEGSKVNGEKVGPPVILEVGDAVRSNASTVGSGEGLSVAEETGSEVADDDGVDEG